MPTYRLSRLTILLPILALQPGQREDGTDDKVKVVCVTRVCTTSDTIRIVSGCKNYLPIIDQRLYKSKYEIICDSFSLSGGYSSNLPYGCGIYCDWSTHWDPVARAKDDEACPVVRRGEWEINVCGCRYNSSIETNNVRVQPQPKPTHFVAELPYHQHPTP
jgi:hypothetical protein